MTGEDGKPVELGRGAMGVTYKAFDVDLRLPVTLKLIREKYISDESMRLRFLREARAAARLRHSNVASVLHLGRTGSSYFYAMEFVEGETLENLIKRSGRLEVKLALEIATQVAAGLAAVHKQKLVHRDIKPSNIMVNLEDGGAVTAKIIDLGLAKAVNEPGSQAAISMPGSFAGTPEFASPEQFAGVGVDIRSDLYALGVMLWRTLTGESMFRGSPSEVMYQHQHAPLPIEQLAAVPQPVVVLLEVLLEKDPSRRFQNPTELLVAMPTIIGAIDARRRITRQSLQKHLPCRFAGRNSPAASKTGTGGNFRRRIAHCRKRCFWARGCYRGKCYQTARTGATKSAAPGNTDRRQCRRRSGSGPTAFQSYSCFEEPFLAHRGSADGYFARHRSGLDFPTCDPESNTEPRATGGY